jgi:hypothetical protein
MTATISITIEAMVNRSALKLRGSMSSSEYFIAVKFDPQMTVIKSKSKSVEPKRVSASLSIRLGTVLSSAFGIKWIKR